MKQKILRIEYKPASFWAHNLLVALSSNASLKTKHMAWSRLPISALTFSIETRLGALHEIIGQVNENLIPLGQELKDEGNIDTYIARGAVYSFRNESAVRRVLIGANHFIAECRSCFENLACFYRYFSRHYFSENISKPTSYATIASLNQDSRWADDLRDLRHYLAHDHAPWLAFLVRNGSERKYEPILDFSSTSTGLTESDYVPFETLRRIDAGLAEAVQALAKRLALRVESTKTHDSA